MAYLEAHLYSFPPAQYYPDVIRPLTTSYPKKERKKKEGRKEKN